MIRPPTYYVQEVLYMTEEKLNEWKRILQDQKESGMTIKKYCEDNHINQKTFYDYKKRFNQLDVRFQEVKLKQDKIIHLKIDGVRIEIDLGDVLMLMDAWKKS